MFQSDQSDVILCSVISDYDRYACGASLDNASFSCATFFVGGSGSGDWTDSGDDCGEIQGCSALVFGADGSADVSDTGYLSNVDSAGMVIPSGNDKPSDQYSDHVPECCDLWQTSRSGDASGDSSRSCTVSWSGMLVFL